MGELDVIIENGMVFDGSGAPGVRRHVGVRDGRVEVLSEAPLPRGPSTRVIDATGQWVMPGFVDLHTHYDAEVELAPGLLESVRHGVTTVALGSCSLSLAVGAPEDLADQFARVEAIPYDVVRALLEQKTWNSHREYFAHLDQLALGPNVCSFVGHSAIRAHVLGMERSVARGVTPTEAELRQMETLVQEGLDEGCLGLSVQTLPWDKVGGARPMRSRPLPSTYASWSEYRRLLRPIRERGLVFQGVPNVSTKVNIVLFLLESAGFFVRKKLKTTVISMMDAPGQRFLRVLQGWMSRAVNVLFGGDFRWQALPEKFDLWADGIDLVVFEEFGAGAAALHLIEDHERARLLADPTYRAWFRGQWTSKLLPRIFHRNLASTEILRAPDPSLVGKSFAQVAKERNQDVADTFLDLVVQHGRALRWYTVMTNDRPRVLEQIVSHPDVLIGFSDAGAHLRNMAHYNFPLRMLRVVQESIKRGEPCMPVEKAVWRLTGELARWLNLDVGVLAAGRQADVAVIDPTRLTETLDVATEAAMPFFDGFVRMVSQNDGAVRTVLVNGREVVRDGAPVKELGARKFGRVLRATPASGPRASKQPRVDDALAA
jgi:N-acyl-D-aspartate/D-glutamate deacylase